MKKGKKNMNINEIKKIQTRHEKALLSKPNVVSVGIGYKVVNGKTTDELALIAGVSAKMPSIQMSGKDVVPRLLDGCPVDVMQVGVISTFPKPKKKKAKAKKVVPAEPVRTFSDFDTTARYRPAIPGTSIAHFNVTAGTFGCVVQKGGLELLLSNNHVLANSNDASVGDPIFQPGPLDGGTSADQIGTLYDFVQISMGGGGTPPAPSPCPIGNGVAGVANMASWAFRRKTRLQAVVPQAANKIDAALCFPTEDYVKEIHQIGKPVGVVDATIGMELQKYGRTTQYTTGKALQVNVTVNVSYGPGKIAQYVGQILAGEMSAGGDSGSLVLDMENHAVGLLFAGSTETTIINHIDDVFSILGVELAS